MAILNFQKPDKVIMIDSQNSKENSNSVHLNLVMDLLSGTH